MKNALIAILALLSLPAHGTDQYYFKYGISLPKEGNPGSKLFSVGRTEDLPYGLFTQLEAGVVNTPAYATGTALLAGASLGLRVEFGPQAAITAAWGPAYYSRKDENLGGNFQFNQDLCLEGKDDNNVVALCYKHVSSAGIALPNRGLDALQIRLGCRF